MSYYVKELDWIEMTSEYLLSDVGPFGEFRISKYHGDVYWVRLGSTVGPMVTDLGFYNDIQQCKWIAQDYYDDLVMKHLSEVSIA